MPADLAGGGGGGDGGGGTEGGIRVRLTARLVWSGAALALATGGSLAALFGAPAVLASTRDEPLRTPFWFVHVAFQGVTLALTAAALFVHPGAVAVPAVAALACLVPLQFVFEAAGARELLRGALGRSEPRDAAGREARARWLLAAGAVEQNLGQLAQASQYHAAAFSLARALGDEHLAATAAANEGIVVRKNRGKTLMSNLFSDAPLLEGDEGEVSGSTNPEGEAPLGEEVPAWAT